MDAHVLEKSIKTNASKEFDKLIPTTMTLVARLNGTVNRVNATPLMEVYHMDPAQCHRSRKKVVIPHPGKSGLITTINYGNCNRGIVKSKRPFRNSIMLVISTSTKNVNIKLSKKTIQMCGAPNFETAQEAIDGLMKNLLYCQKMIEYMEERKDDSEVCARWVKTKTKGPQVEVNGEKLHTIVMPEELTEGFPIIIDKYIAAFILRRAVDFSFHRDYCKQIDWILTFPKLCTPDITSSRVMSSMVNYNYYIGHSIDRWKLCREVNGLGIKGVSSRFLNTIDNSARITMEYEIPARLADQIRKRNDKKRFTILVHRTGQVTLTGPHPEMNRIAYIAFADIIATISDDIRLDYGF